MSCSCGHCAHAQHSEPPLRWQLIRLMVGAAVALAAVLLPIGDSIKGPRLSLFIAALVITGYPVFKTAVEHILHGKWFDEMFLMSLAAIGAFLIGEYIEGILVAWLFQIGEILQERALERSRASIRALSRIRPDFARCEQDGEVKVLRPEQVEIGDVLLVLPGDRVPLDGEVLSGESSLDTAALTGESLPRAVQAGSKVLSGCINLQSPLHIRVTAPYRESTVARILTFMEEAEQKKSRADRFITRFSKVYTPFVVWMALLLLLCPPLFFGQSLQAWAHVALSFLVISCPCSLVISVPLTYFAGIGAASRAGLLIKGANTLEALSHAAIIALDKTGTLTQGRLSVTSIHASGISEKELLALAAAAESRSTHPIARAVLEAYGEQPQPAKDIREIPGQGIVAQVDGHEIAAGNLRLMEKVGVRGCLQARGNTCLYLAQDGRFLGWLSLSDTLRPGAKEALDALETLGIRKRIMLTGDVQSAAQHISDQLNLTAFHAELLPADKVRHMDALQKEKEKGETLLFIGDGINDAPVLSCADVGIAMGGLGSEATIEAADAVLMDDDLRRLPTALSIAGRTQRIVYQNIVFSLAVKALIMGANLLFALPLWLSVIADVGVCFIAILNSLRASKHHA